MTKKTGILIANLGTPDTPTPQGVFQYLVPFLTDWRVIDTPRWKWIPLLKLMILPKRSFRVAKLYQSIWTKDGSPLLVISNQQRQFLQESLDPSGENIIVELGMSYGNPNIVDAHKRLMQQNIDELIILPLYPQYSSTTTASVFDAYAKAIKPTFRKILPFKFIHNYHDHPLYIEALANSIKAKQDQFDHLVFSFHGIPKRYVTEGDYYPEQCERTAKLVAEKLGLTDDQWRITFQSRFGPEEWLQPYTDETMSKLPAEGITRLGVICPGFAVDCLETVDEIDNENREIFLNAGGHEFTYIPALNANKDHIKLLAELCKEYMDKK